MLKICTYLYNKKGLFSAHCALPSESRLAEIKIFGTAISADCRTISTWLWTILLCHQLILSVRDVFLVVNCVDFSIRSVLKHTPLIHHDADFSLDHLDTGILHANLCPIFTKSRMSVGADRKNQDASIVAGHHLLDVRATLDSRRTLLNLQI